MSERTERGTLNRLIETCRDGELGFGTAAGHVADPDVKALFLEIAAQREQFIRALLPHAHRLGGATETDGTVAGTLHRGWISIKDTLSHHDDAAIIREADRGERAALAAFQDAINGMLPPESRELIETQYAGIQHTHRRLDSFLSREVAGG
jgi:uncharacterized protein (TIGR02284 family)